MMTMKIPSLPSWPLINLVVVLLPHGFLIQEPHVTSCQEKNYIPLAKLFLVRFGNNGVEYALGHGTAQIENSLIEISLQSSKFTI